ncbi:ankyrin repeat domain-containing protein [Methylomonas sp. LL1]|uniref:ankyrin repeat domain-containing protein n=1 Tax=Methylomonas sp. LL1 TaxID=2785785 RepID=UPI0018C3EEAA|nr:ankyrin repeat domain-containing protein [Methylomonas sp. LL1]QPK62957.1 ankyrin repeat domain-containing protein [Methylomonas sp. LL1]
MQLHDDISRWLLDNGFDSRLPLTVNNSGKHALILAAQQARDDVLSRLIQQGADLKVLDAYGNNALWAACFAESNACIALLLQAGIDIDYQNPSGASALTYSSSSGKHLVVAQLLQAGANPLLTTQDDFSALDLAASRECLQLMRNAVKALASS